MRIFASISKILLKKIFTWKFHYVVLYSFIIVLRSSSDVHTEWVLLESKIFEFCTLNRAGSVQTKPGSNIEIFIII